MNHTSTNPTIITGESTQASPAITETASIPSKLHPYDVLCDRSRTAFNYVGNRRFRIIVENYAERYAKIASKSERTRMVLTIVNTVHQAGGRFLAKDGTDSWDNVPLIRAKEKVGHALRFSISSKEKGETRTILDVIAFDSFPEEPRKKKRKLSDGVVTPDNDVPSAESPHIVTYAMIIDTLANKSDSEFNVRAFGQPNNVFVSEETNSLLEEQNIGDSVAKLDNIATSDEFSLIDALSNEWREIFNAAASDDNDQFIDDELSIDLEHQEIDQDLLSAIERLIQPSACFACECF